MLPLLRFLRWWFATLLQGCKVDRDEKWNMGCNYSGMLIGHTIAILCFLAIKNNRGGPRRNARAIQSSASLSSPLRLNFPDSDVFGGFQSLRHRVFAFL